MQDMSGSAKRIFIVDDDPLVRGVLSTVFSASGFDVVCFADGAALLDEARAHTPACIILDVHIPGDSGLNILAQLNAQDYPAPIFIMSGQGDIAMAVQAIRTGALDFIEKPFRGSEVVKRVQDAIDAYTRRPKETESNAADFHFAGREPLSRRERDVLALLVKGASNKEAGRELGISPRTIEDHRARIMAKLGARNAADLIRIVLNREAVR
jgi:FixJ family two-component response regulator